MRVKFKVMASNPDLAEGDLIQGKPLFVPLEGTGEVVAWTADGGVAVVAADSGEFYKVHINYLKRQGA